MIKIGITGGVGTGKSTVLSYLEKTHNAYVLRTDELARDLVLAGTELNVRLHQEFPEELFLSDGNMDRVKMAEYIFQDPKEREHLDSIIHPGVKEEIIHLMHDLKKEGEVEIFVVEAALLIEEQYDQILDEIWYVDAPEAIRRERLKSSRNYSDEKIDGIIRNQLSPEDFRKSCDVTIMNDGAKEQVYLAIDKEIERIRQHIVV